MVRTQIQLTEAQVARLKAVATRRGISMAEVIRQAVDAAATRADDRDPEILYERARSIAGKFRSSTSDVSSRHDEYLAGSYTP